MEIILNKLLYNTSQTLQKQYTHLINQYILQPTQNQSILAILPSIWSSDAATQIIVLATQVIIELALQEAVNASTTISEGEQPLQLFLNKIHNLIATACGIIRTSKPLDAPVDPLIESNSSTEKHSEVLGKEQPYTCMSTTRQMSWKYHRLQSVMTVLLWSKDKVKYLISSCKSNSIVELSFAWQASLHFRMQKATSTAHHKHSCVLSTLSSHLPYGFSYTGSQMSGMVLGLVSEQSFVHLLQYMGQHNSVLINVKSVSAMMYIVYIYMYLYFFSAFSDTFVHKHSSDLVPTLHKNYCVHVNRML